MSMFQQIYSLLICYNTELSNEMKVNIKWVYSTEYKMKLQYLETK
jgi:hypothetical protein